MKKLFLRSLLFLIFTNAYSQDLPGRHQLIKNDLGEYHIVNSENITMIEPLILKLVLFQLESPINYQGN